MPLIVSLGDCVYWGILTFPVTTTRSSSSQGSNNRAESHLNTLLPEFTTHVVTTVKGKGLVPAIHYSVSVLFSLVETRISYLAPT
jgi:hypothetical protein